jgi:hypothetical protein
MRLLILGALFLSQVSLAQTVMVMTWKGGEGARSFEVRRDNCEGDVVYSGPERMYRGPLDRVTDYCLKAENMYGWSDPHIVTVDPEGKPPGAVKAVIININIKVE